MLHKSRSYIKACFHFISVICIYVVCAVMAELADAIDLGSIVNRRAGSSPVNRSYVSENKVSDSSIHSQDSAKRVAGHTADITIRQFPDIVHEKVLRKSKVFVIL